MTRYQLFRSLHEYAESMEKNYSALKKTLAGACGKMEAEAEVVPPTAYYQSLRVVSWPDFFFRSNYSSRDEFVKIAANLETEPIPGVMQYEMLAKLAGISEHDSFQQRMETAASVLNPMDFYRWMTERRDEVNGIDVKSSDDGVSIGAIHLTLPLDMETVGKLCAMYPEIAPALSKIIMGDDDDA